jgi:hypothetical protein
VQHVRCHKRDAGTDADGPRRKEKRLWLWCGPEASRDAEDSSRNLNKSARDRKNILTQIRCGAKVPEYQEGNRTFLVFWMACLNFR